MTSQESTQHRRQPHPRGPAGVRIDLRGARRKDPVVPITALTVPAEQLVEEILRARAGARRG